MHSENYPRTVGALGFAAPEAYCGLRSCRDIGHLTDIYALGALLYQMFNSHIFYDALSETTWHVCNYMTLELSKVTSDAQKLKIWRSELKKFHKCVYPPDIYSRGHCIPAAIIQPLSTLHKKMTMFDFDSRIQDLESVLRHIDICINILENNRLEEKRRLRRENKKTIRLKKNELKDRKIAEYLQKRKVLSDV